MPENPAPMIATSTATAHILTTRNGRCGSIPHTAGYHPDVIILGLILLLIGFAAGIGILYTLGIVLIIVGLVLMLMGRADRPFGGRAHYW